MSDTERQMHGTTVIAVRRGGKVATAFNMHPQGGVDHRENLYYLETADITTTIFQEAVCVRKTCPV